MRCRSPSQGMLILVKPPEENQASPVLYPLKMRLLAEIDLPVAGVLKTGRPTYFSLGLLLQGLPT